METPSLKSYFTRSLLEAGCDEAGRGCLAGPVAAAAVILPHNFYHPLLNDSKKLTERQRMLLKPYIEENAIAYAVAMVDNTEIDSINILNASFLAMHRAISCLSATPQQLLIDGNRFNAYKDIPHQCIIKGDSKYAAIAAASVLAKTSRDMYMEQLAESYPAYGWKRNKGYPTKQHRLAIKEYGPSPFHRKSFRWYDEQPELF